MILESIKIGNIRSIKNLELAFPRTTMLFYGDIGSGKSSVLKAIEFALFGALTSADLSGDSVLRRGENRASVELTFLLDNDRYVIKRGLSKNKKGKVSQTKGSLTINESETSYAPTDLRRKILETLNYSVTRYERAQKIDLFRYTVYTPQESVKEILEAEPDKRFEILKDVFGIEKYEVALRNIKIIGDFLRDDIKETEIRIGQFEGIEDMIPEKINELQVQESKISSMEKEREFKKNELNLIQKDLDVIKSKKEDISKKIIELDSKEKTFKEYTELKEQHAKDLKTAQNNINTNEEEAKKIVLVKLSIDLTEDQIREKISEIRKQISEKEKKKAVIEQKIKDIDELLEKGKCSLCGQEIHEEKRFKGELKDALGKVDSFSNEIDVLSKNVDILEVNLKELQEFTSNKSKIELYQKLVEASKKQEKDSHKKLDEIIKKIDKLQKEIDGTLKAFKINDITELKKLELDIKENLDSFEGKIEKLKSQKNIIEIDLSAERKTQEYLKKEVNELKAGLEEKRKLKEKLEYSTEIRNWVKEQFPILLRDIERQILISSARDFNMFFKEWFNILVESGNIEVEIRPDDFQPLINVNGYDS
ncbi:MAG TPA: SMC family ATPase, partial [Candidatus Paceibacterota bacterium]|nr:SMC family ATPase [Candidatus Paceibacterota bacterium]